MEKLKAALADRYTLERELGRGGMASVYLAHDLKHDRPVALKLLHPGLTHSLGPERFLREIRTTARLDHPHILPVHDSGEAAGLLWYTMPYVEGHSLRERLRRQVQLPVDEAVRLAREVGDALDYAHRHGIVHRDVKPENILLGEGHARVADFGVARALEAASDGQLTETGMAVGTPAYMSPEQASGGTVGAPSDIYALGCILYEMLAGEPPFTGPTPQALMAKRFADPVPSIRRVREGVPEGVEQALTRALARVPADRYTTAAEFVETLRQAVARPARGREPRRLLPLPIALGVAAALVLAVAAALLWRSRGPPKPLDDDLVAVAPFDVPDPRLALWREGLVDLLSRNLDGAGPLRSVPPTTVIHRWRGRADRLSASALSRRTGAGLVVFGSLIGTGPDSARLTVTTLELPGGRPIAELELRDATDRMDRLADSLTVRLLRELGRTRRIDAFRTAAVGSTTLPALKAFLQGEQWFRRAAWDSAAASYERAIAVDSAFPLALRRLGQVWGWQRSAYDSISDALKLRAGALNHGLAPRDSLLVTAESLSAALFSTTPFLDWQLLQRVHAVARELTRRYPDDFESWYTLGEAHFHFSSLGSTPRETLDAFDRAIASDSSFAPAYIHPIELGTRLAGPQAGRRYALAYLRLAPTDVFASGIRLASELLAPGIDSGRMADLLSHASPAALHTAWLQLRSMADPGEAALQIARALSDAPPGDAPWLSEANRQARVGSSLLYRGRVQAAAPILFHSQEAIPPQLVEAAILSPPGSPVDTLLREWIRKEPLFHGGAAVPWWTARRDSISLHEFARWSDSASRAAPSEVERGLAVYGAQSALAYLALVRRDTTEALRRLEALPDSLCPLCYFERLAVAQLLSARQEDDKAATLLERTLTELTVPSQVIWSLERARVHERLGDRDAAARDYQYVADVWRHADRELQPYVADAREGLARVTGEPRN